MGNRIVANFKAKLGQEAGHSEKEIDAIGKTILAELRQSFNRITDGVAKIPSFRKFKGDEVISSYTELCLIAQYIELDKQESEHFKRLGVILQEHPIYAQWLSGVHGVGPAMAGVLISEIDIHKARHPSSLWKYSGMDVASDGMGRSKKKEHLIEVEYQTRDGKMDTRQSITFNPFLKSKLLGVLASSFLRSNNEKYVKLYGDYKHRMEHHARWGVHNDGQKDEKGHALSSKGRRHNQAMRYMIKIFLIDLYTEWRRLEGLPVSTPYSEGKLGMVHGKDVK